MTVETTLGRPISLNEYGSGAVRTVRLAEAPGRVLGNEMVTGTSKVVTFVVVLYVAAVEKVLAAEGKEFERGVLYTLEYVRSTVSVLTGNPVKRSSRSSRDHGMSLSHANVGDEVEHVP